MSRSAEQPGSSKRQRDVLLDQVGVAYILCEDTAERLELPERHRALVDVLQNAVEQAPMLSAWHFQRPRTPQQC